MQERELTTHKHTAWHTCARTHTHTFTLLANAKIVFSAKTLGFMGLWWRVDIYCVAGRAAVCVVGCVAVCVCKAGKRVNGYVSVLDQRAPKCAMYNDCGTDLWKHVYSVCVFVCVYLSVCARSLVTQYCGAGCTDFVHNQQSICVHVCERERKRENERVCVDVCCGVGGTAQLAAANTLCVAVHNIQYTCNTLCNAHGKNTASHNATHSATHTATHNATCATTHPSVVESLVWVVE